MTHEVAVGIDVGGTKVVAGVVHNDGRVTERVRVASPQGDGRAIVDEIVRVIRGLDRPDLPIGIGMAGIVGRDGTLRHSPNHGVDDVPISAWVRDELDSAPIVLNDATAALWAEHRFGAARGRRSVVMVTLGTGVGGGLMIDGNLVEGANGFAGEFGHIIVDAGGRPCFCGNTGCLETYASGTAIGKTAAQWLAEGRGTKSTLARPGPDVAPITGKGVTDAALAGDDFARDVLREAGRWLGIGLVGLVAAIDPELVVVGGGASVHAAPWVLGEARKVLGERLIGAKHRPIPDVVLAQLGDDAGMIGAGTLAAG